MTRSRRLALGGCALAALLAGPAVPSAAQTPAAPPSSTIVTPAPPSPTPGATASPTPAPPVPAPLRIVTQTDVATPVPAPTFAHAAIRPAAGGDAWSDAAVAKLRGDVDALLRDPAFRGAHVGVVAQTAAGDTLVAHAADDEFQPASTLKLLVGSTALERLGPAFRFRTSLDAALEPLGPSDAPGTIAALVLRGGGDPLLAPADVDAAALAAARAGIRAVRDDVAVDSTRYDDVPHPAGWVWDDFGEDYAPAVTALTYDENVAHYAVAPGAAVGNGARATLDGRAVDAAVAGCAHPGLVVLRATTGPSGSESTLDATVTRGGCVALIGAVPLDARGPESIDVAVSLPEVAARARLVAGLRAHGIAFTDAAAPDAPAEHRSVSGATTVWSHASAPLASWLGPRFWLPSDNLVAELLLKEVGVATGGKPGSTAKGVAAEVHFLREAGVDPATVTLADGSGLSQYDRITPRDLVAILRHDWNEPFRDLVLDALPVGGARGTIEGIAGTSLAGRVFAKTGSMSHVRGLAGYLATRRHGVALFAFSVDDWNGDGASLAAARARVLARIAND